MRCLPAQTLRRYLSWIGFISLLHSNENWRKKGYIPSKRSSTSWRTIKKTIRLISTTGRMRMISYRRICKRSPYLLPLHEWRRRMFHRRMKQKWNMRQMKDSPDLCACSLKKTLAESLPMRRNGIYIVWICRLN